MQDVISALESQRVHSAATLAAALDRPISIDDVVPWIRFDPQNYVRALVARTDRWELRLLCWKPRQSSSFHGHGPAACAFRVLRGSATESILGERDRTWAPGDVVQESRAGLVHQVRNAGADSLLTLHAYSPPLPVDAPSQRGGHNVVIVGGGFSGIALAVHLLRCGGEDLRVTVVERGPWLGRGVAYGVDSEVFRLNVPASRMSLDPDRPDDFVRWAGAEAAPHAFLSRTDYGRYVVARFGEALCASPAKLRVVRGEVVGVESHAVRLGDDEVIAADAVVLATGLAPRVAPSALIHDPRIIDSWDECALAGLPRDGRFLILGAGLSALDVIAFLNAHQFRGTVSIVSRHGLLPRPHVSTSTSPLPLPAEVVASAPNDLRGLLRWGRKIIADATARGAPWQHGFDALRPHVAGAWRRMDSADRSRFVRAVRPYWEVLRHRAPEDTYALVRQWESAGRLEVFAGTLASCTPSDNGLDVVLRLPDGSERRTRYDAIVRCIGPALQREESDAPVIRALIASGIASVDPARLGIVTDEHGRVVGPDGRPSESVFALGVLRRPSSWETTAVPDIAVQARALARRIADLGRASRTSSGAPLK